MNKPLSMLIASILVSVSALAANPTTDNNTNHTYQDTVQDAFKAAADGNHQRSIEIFEGFAERGDSDAMIQLGMVYQTGRGVEPDYTKAMDWFMQAMKKSNQEAPGNIGVLYRDGLGVEKNRKIAYTLFLYTNMYGLGGRSTQERAVQNIKLEYKEQPLEDIQEALCYTWPYVKAYMNQRGPVEIDSKLLPTEKSPRIKDHDWWKGPNHYRTLYDCPAPWNYAAKAQPNSDVKPATDTAEPPKP